MPSSTANPRVVLAKLPGEGPPVVGEHIVLDTKPTIDLDSVPLNGGFLTKTLLLSPEPAMRERMRDPSIPSYSTHMPVGAPLVGFGLVVVLRSEKEGIKAGDHLYGQTLWEAYTVQPYVEGRIKFDPAKWPKYTFDMDSLALQVVPNPGGAFPWTKYCSALGTPGLTAFVGFEGYFDAKPGQTLFVSSGASAVGVMLIQLAKIKGLKVIGSAGSDAKVEYIRSLGADAAFNYKKTSYSAGLKEHGPIDLYWDNVGGEALDAALEHADLHATFVLCGSSSEYNVPAEKRYGVKNTGLIFKKRITIKGLLVPDLIPTLGGRFFNEVPALLATGKLKFEDNITEGWEKAPAAFVDMLKGGHDAVGKPIIKVADE